MTGGHLPTIAECLRRLRDGSLTVPALVRRCLDAIERDNHRLHALVAVDVVGALAEAERAQTAIAEHVPIGPLHGVPVVVKDTIHVRGLPTRYGSRASDRGPEPTDAVAIANLRRAGAIIIGKATTWELGCGVGEFQSLAGGPEALNPHDTAFFAGGSSSGSAVAVAAGFACGSVGGDTGGSIRAPASACGVVGLKPTFGLIDRDGALAHSQSLDHLGAMAADAVGAHLLCAAMAGLPSLARIVSPSEGPVRIGALTIDGLVDTEISSLFDAALARCAAHGARVTPISLDEPVADWRKTMEVIGGYDSAARHRSVVAGEQTVSPSIRTWLSAAADISADAYRRALARRETLAAAFQALFRQVDVVACPTMTKRVPRQTDEAARIRFCVEAPLALFNLTGHPALSIPMGQDQNGMPAGVQLIGPRGSEPVLTRFAAGYTKWLAPQF